MGGEGEQRDARSAHAGALWSLMERQMPPATRVDEILGEPPRTWFSQYGVHHSGRHSFFWVLHAHGRGPEVVAVGDGASQDITHTRIQSDEMWNGHPGYGTHEPVKGRWELEYIKDVDY